VKNQIKIRKKWLINSDTKIETSKKIKQRFQEDDNEEDWKQYEGITVIRNMKEDVDE
jgi:hypothetical protein